MPSWTAGVSASCSDVTRRLPRSSTSHAQPLAKWFTASSCSFSSSACALPNPSSINLASLPSGCCPLVGLRHCQKKLWFHSCALLLNSLLFPDRLASLMTSAHGKNYFTSTSQQTTNLASTNSTKLKNFPLPLPCIEEQRAIVEFLDRRSSLIDSLLGTIGRHIARLREYRSALVVDLVTRGRRGTKGGIQPARAATVR